MRTEAEIRERIMYLITTYANVEFPESVRNELDTLYWVLGEDF